MKMTICLADVIGYLQTMLQDTTVQIKDGNRELDALECKGDLTEKESRRCEYLQYRIEALEANQDALDKALSHLSDVREE